MPFLMNLNTMQALSPTDAQALIFEFNALRAELDDMRAKYAALVALLVAGTALGAGYSSGTAMQAAKFTSA